ncbi:CaiB/BaiF CoA-transferase family protein [Roseomonas sp. AR75]|uniref:CaiB/BaiF CoA transferase family protein n=1 Tax=Roseomonas sp. AR75 TaxID=2562311 RepID=UPI0014851E5D|nr:CaiB/BaiF CoA-transferase family protein [Roseomonas sp. AR75]
MRALEGFRILDFSHVIAGPFCTAQLGLLGAEVIKVEAPEGDYMRGRGGDDALRRIGMGDHFAVQNGNKRSIVIDLQTDQGRALARRLAARADAVVENFRPGVMARLGLDYATLAAANPRLVMCSLSGFGAEGALAERPVYDNVVQAFSGLMAMTGTAESGPLKAGAPMLDYASGTMAAFALTAALLRRERTGQGQHVELSMLDTAFLLMGPVISSLLNGGRAPRLHANEHALAGASCYAAADGALIMLGACTQRQFETLCRRIGRADLLDDPRFADVRRQDPHRAALSEILAAEMRRRPAAEWEALLADTVPAARVRSLVEALNDSDAAGRGVVAEAPWPSASGRVAIPVAAWRAAADGPSLDRAPPRLGEDTDAVLAEAGLEPDEIATLRASGALG